MDGTADLRICILMNFMKLMRIADSLMGWVSFPGTVQHESVGHGLGLLGDEYVQEENPDMIPESEKKRLRACHDWGVY